MKIYLYLLKLINNKYYIGQTDNIEFRFKEHKEGTGAKWTRINTPVEVLVKKEIKIKNLREAILYENWMTLHYMEKYGWRNVRGGDFLKAEDYQVAKQLGYIFDIENNKIKYYTQSHYLFGATDSWLVYTLELDNSKYYIGSTKRLGESLSKHFNGNGIKWTKENRPKSVIETLVIKPDENYLVIKREKLMEYISKYGKENVVGGQNE